MTYEVPKRTMEDFEVPPIFIESKMSKCDLPESQKQIIIRWALKPHGFLLLTGNAGRGKTYASCAALDEYRANKGWSARFVNVSDLYLKWRAASKYGEEYELAKSYSSPYVIVLDDLGMRTPTDSFLDFLYAILNKRVNENFGTIVTTNMNSVQMIEKMGEAISSRICSGEIIKVEGSDKRLIRGF